jgi:hypothetical protein
MEHWAQFLRGLHRSAEALSTGPVPLSHILVACFVFLPLALLSAAAAIRSSQCTAILESVEQARRDRDSAETGSPSRDRRCA